MLGIEDTVLNQLMQAELNRVLDDSKDTMSLVMRIDTEPLEIPELVSETLLRFKAIINAPHLYDVASVRTEPGANHRAVAIKSNLFDGSFGKTPSTGIGAHRTFS